MATFASEWSQNDEKGGKMKNCMICLICVVVLLVADLSMCNVATAGRPMTW